MNPFFYLTEQTQPNTTLTAEIGAIVNGSMVYQRISIPIDQTSFTWNLTSVPVAEVKLFDSLGFLLAKATSIAANGNWQALQMQTDSGGAAAYELMVSPDANAIVLIDDDLIVEPVSSDPPTTASSGI